MNVTIEIELTHKRHAKTRPCKGTCYWFIDTSRRSDSMFVRKCRETGHRFDDEMFATGNYYMSSKDAAADMRDFRNLRNREAYKVRKIRGNAGSTQVKTNKANVGAWMPMPKHDPEK